MTTSYLSNELSFELPVPRAAVQDRTIHELAVPGSDGACDVSLAVSRQPLAMPLAAAVDDLHREERRSLGAFEITSATTRALGDLEWIDTRFSWKHPSGPVYHRRLHCQVGALWMSVTATVKLENAAWADQVAEHVVGTFRTRPQEG